MSVLDGVEADLAAIAERAPYLKESALAAMARELATQMDARNSATSKAMCAKALTDILDQLRALAPEKEEGDKLDDLAARRDARIRSATA